jgi:hypothetical protein
MDMPHRERFYLAVDVHRPGAHLRLELAEGLVQLVELVVHEEAMPLVKSRGKDTAAPSPRLPLKNLYFQIFRRGPRATLGHDKTAVGWIELLRALRMDARLLERFPAPEAERMKGETPRPIVNSGWWRFDTFHAVPRRRIELDVLLPLVDSDAVLAPTRDCLQRAGFLDADARIVGDSTTIGLRARGQLLIVRLVRLEDPGELVEARWPGLSFLDLEEGADA